MDICSEGSKLLDGPTGEKGLGVRRGQHRAGKGQGPGHGVLRFIGHGGEFAFCPKF